MKKFIAMTLSICMILSTASVALADEIVECSEETIVVEDAQNDQGVVVLDESESVGSDLIASEVEDVEILTMDGECISSGVLEFNKNYEIPRMERGQSAKYDFSLNESGTVSIAASRELVSDGSWEPTIGIYNSADEKVWSYSMEKGNEVYVWDLLAGDYYMTISANSMFLNVWKFSFTAEFEGSGESVSEKWTNKNDQINTATKYSIGKKVKGYFADNEERDIYKVKISKPGYLTIKVDSRVPAMGLKLYDSKKRIDIDYSDIQSGNNVYKEFVPSGTYYLEAYKRNDKAGVYTLSTSLKDLPTITIKSASAKIYGNRWRVLRTLNLKWKKNSAADGYQIQVSNKSNFKSKKTYEIGSESSSLTINDFKFAKGKNYVRIRQYKKIGDGAKVYSEWSKVKSVNFAR